MNQYEMTGVTASVQMFRHIAVFGSLLFSVAALSFWPLGSSLRYYTDVLAAFSLIYILMSCREINWTIYGKSFVYCCAPFLPFLFVYLATKAYHGLNLFDDGIFFTQLVILLVTSSVVFGVLVQSRKIPLALFFGCCAVASVLYFLDIVATAWINDVPIWKVKGYVHPCGTTYARCICISSGLSLLGFFLLPVSKIKLRYACLGASILGFCATIWFMAIRSVILTPLLALIIGFCASPLKIRTKVWTLLLFSVLAAVLVIQSPIVPKMRVAYEEAMSVISTDAVNVTLSNISKPEQTPKEAKIQKYLNTSIGARIAVWGVAARALEDQMWVGTGMGRPHNFVDTKKLFKFSHDYLKHFHSDYVQVGIVGGIIFLLSFLTTQLWLFIRSLKNPLALYLTLSMVSYGLVDYGFLDRRVLVCYLGACLIIWSWHYPKKQTQIDGKT